MAASAVRHFNLARETFHVFKEELQNGNTSTRYVFINICNDSNPNLVEMRPFSDSNIHVWTENMVDLTSR